MMTAFGIWMWASFGLLGVGMWVLNTTFHAMNLQVDPPTSWFQLFRRNLWVTNARAERVMKEQQLSGKHPRLLRANRFARIGVFAGVVSLAACFITMFATIR